MPSCHGADTAQESLFWTEYPFFLGHISLIEKPLAKNFRKFFLREGNDEFIREV
jgi:hypothetical protein